MKKILKLYKILKNHNYLAALSKKVAAAIEHEAILKTINYSSVVDIGANKGQFSLVAKTVAPQTLILAFEPLSAPVSRFKCIFHNTQDINVYQFAISNSEGSSIIHVSQKEDSSSLLPIGKLQNQIFPGTKESHTETITTKCLDSVLTEEQIIMPALLKLDVQGFELNALKGCESLLHRFEHIYVECSFVELYEGQSLAHEVIAMLQAKNFKLKGIYNTYYDKNGIAIQADFLFQKN